MLTLTKKQYELEEEIQLLNEYEEVIYSFTMKITPDEMKEIKDLMFDDKDLANGRKMAKLEETNKIDELSDLETKVLDRAKKKQKKLENIWFKDHKEEFKEKAGEYKYEEMFDMIFDFFMKTFVDKKVKQVNTMNTSLKKITNN